MLSPVWYTQSSIVVPFWDYLIRSKIINQEEELLWSPLVIESSAQRWVFVGGDIKNDDL